MAPTSIGVAVLKDGRWVCEDDPDCELESVSAQEFWCEEGDHYVRIGT
jgi:hypothetical protein